MACTRLPVLESLGTESGVTRVIDFTETLAKCTCSIDILFTKDHNSSPRVQKQAPLMLLLDRWRCYKQFMALMGRPIQGDEDLRVLYLAQTPACACPTLFSIGSSSSGRNISDKKLSLAPSYVEPRVMIDACKRSYASSIVERSGRMAQP
ncbi:hypothetical protein VNO77_02144 [Canavalia gladiata]|uniref:Uncharacterized protein n=1 Tax=Canavalia gladiata TaxID=3824 RepID=A0AAN9MXD3_CANGL